MGMVAHDRVRALKTLAIVEPLLCTNPVTKQQLKARIRDTGNHYKWCSGESPEFDADLRYLHGIIGLTESGRGYNRGDLTDYFLGKV